jgi:hypothetical protein
MKQTATARFTRALWLLPLGLLAACGDTGQPMVHHSIFAVGTEAKTQTFGAWEVKLDVAQIAFGPVKFCASRSAADELCPGALAEYADSAGAIDVLSSKPQRLGQLDGFVGTVRSAAYDYALTWLPTQTAPAPTSHALAGHSAHLEGTVTSKATRTLFHFIADVDIVSNVRGTHAVTTTALDTNIDETITRLDVRFDPNAWLAQLDLDALSASGEEPVRIRPGSRPHNALVVAMTSLAPPSFTWARTP